MLQVEFKLKCLNIYLHFSLFILADHLEFIL